MKNSTLRARPLVIAHRGFSWRGPENTLASYRLAIEAGARLAECDVHLSKDGIPVLIHDDQLSRTTNGKGIVRELT
ncbi:MAG TPA: glycerophosphodiester phosphodiesterase, partial [Myxococcales bacterium]|nr:glycerophosphodiester phosphodiesterase [Myxococcales bacterium]